MKTSIGGDRLGSGSKQNVSLKNYSRSTHDMSYIWRSSMSSGTLVPFMSEVALPGDSWDIDLDVDVKTLPTVGPLFGSYKIQLDVFHVPIRLYNAGLHMNRLGIGNDMSQVKLPKVRVRAITNTGETQSFEDNAQINSSCLLKYLGISGIGQRSQVGVWHNRNFNAVPYLGYWEIYKNYYANKQEERGFAVHTSTTQSKGIEAANLYTDNVFINDILGTNIAVTTSTAIRLNIVFEQDTEEPDSALIKWTVEGNVLFIEDSFEDVEWNGSTRTLECSTYIAEIGSVMLGITQQSVKLVAGGNIVTTEEFPLSNIDDMRDSILQFPFSAGEFVVNSDSEAPYKFPMEQIIIEEQKFAACQYTQEGLGIKTYQSDLFNNWISTEWIDGTNGINEITSVSTEDENFTIDALNLASKVYTMLNRIAISGGSYDDWLDAVYTHERSKSAESPVYHGSLIKELGFQEVVSNGTDQTGEQPLGTLAGRGKMTGKNKGGKIKIKIDEPSYIMGIVSITPRIDYSQGNKWDVNLDTLNDLHKPALDGIGYQDLITEQMSWTDTQWLNDQQKAVYRSAGKQPAWINYMSNVNKVYGAFAEENNSMFMTLNRRYEKNAETGRIEDLTTYIDPAKYNNIFAQTALDSQNFWVQISNNITARRKMSAKIIPNL